MTVEGVTIAVFACGYREEAPPDPNDITPDDPNGLLYRKGEYGHDYCLLSKECPGCDGDTHNSVYPYADRGIRIVIRK